MCGVDEDVYAIETKEGRSFTLLHGILFFGIFYALSPGPVLFILVKTGLADSQFVFQIFTFFYYAHVLIAMFSEYYLMYVFWWFDVAGMPL
jgi:hypothetical protein